MDGVGISVHLIDSHKITVKVAIVSLSGLCMNLEGICNSSKFL